MPTTILPPEFNLGGAIGKSMADGLSNGLSNMADYQMQAIMQREQAAARSAELQEEYMMQYLYTSVLNLQKEKADLTRKLDAGFRERQRLEAQLQVKQSELKKMVIFQRENERQIKELVYEVLGSWAVGAVLLVLVFIFKRKKA